MRSVAYWIQRADFSASDHEAADAEDAIRAFRTHDWGEELRLQAELQTAGRDCCPPGIGFVILGVRFCMCARRSVGRAWCTITPHGRADSSASSRYPKVRFRRNRALSRRMSWN